MSNSQTTELPYYPPEQYRQRVWELMEKNAKIGNLKFGSIKGNGMPDCIWQIVREEIRNAGI